MVVLHRFISCSTVRHGRAGSFDCAQDPRLISRPGGRANPKRLRLQRPCATGRRYAKGWLRPFDSTRSGVSALRIALAAQRLAGESRASHFAVDIAPIEAARDGAADQRQAAIEFLAQDRKGGVGAGFRMRLEFLPQLAFAGRPSS